MKKQRAVHGDPAAKNGVISSHRFLGGHTWLAAMRKDQTTLRATQKFLRGVASIDIASVRDDKGRQNVVPIMRLIIGSDKTIYCKGLKVTFLQ